MSDPAVHIYIAAQKIKEVTQPELWDALVRSLGYFSETTMQSMVGASNESVFRAQGRAQMALEILKYFHKCTDLAMALNKK